MSRESENTRRIEELLGDIEQRAISDQIEAEAFLRDAEPDRADIRAATLAIFRQMLASHDEHATLDLLGAPPGLSSLLISHAGELLNGTHATGDETVDDDPTASDKPGLRDSEATGPNGDDTDPLVHQRIGQYRLLEEIGRGGFGVVHRARQHAPIRRDVALKIIKFGMDTEHVIARFEAEREALARFDHPNVARVLDAGTTPTGRPYFVMDLIHGPQINDYCDGRRLDIRQRVQLFIDVCQGIQHAHQKGIIHRDIKPSNILVTEIDGAFVAKVIDFGVSKAVVGGHRTETSLTRPGQTPGTPIYMSPEQVRPMGLDIDTRSDVYSLGIVLYELLAGTLPYEDEQGEPRPMDPYRDIAPATPSSRIARHVELESIAHARRLRRDDMCQALRGDLDWIVVEALHPDRSERYATAQALAEDLDRFLKFEPVEAGPISWRYRAGKFAQRNKMGVAWAGVACLAMLGGAIGIAWMYGAAIGARQETAELAAFTVKYVGDISRGWMDGRPVSMTLDEINHLRERCSAILEGQPDMLCDMLLDLGGVTTGMGEFRLGEEIALQALEVAQSLPAPGGRVNGARLNLAAIYAQLHQLEKARGHAGAAIAELEQTDEWPGSRMALSARNVSAVIESLSNNFDEALTLQEELLEQCRTLLGAADDLTLEVTINTAETMRQTMRFREAQGVLDDAIRHAQSQLSSVDRRLLTMQMQRAFMRYLNGEIQPDYLDQEGQRILETVRLAYGEEHPNYRTMKNSHHSLTQLITPPEGDGHELVAEARNYLARQIETYGEDNEEVDVARNRLAQVLWQSGDQDEARKQLRLAIEGFRARGNGLTWVMIQNLAQNELDSGNLAEGIRLFETAVEEMESERAIVFPFDRIMMRINYARGLDLVEETTDAIPLVLAAYEEAALLDVAGLRFARLASRLLADYHRKLGSPGEADSWQDVYDEIELRLYPPDSGEEI